MKMFRPILFSGLALVSCRGVGQDQEALPEPGAAEASFKVEAAAPTVAAPMDLDGSYDSTAAFILARHDADGDGQVTREEYQRGETGFARLDKDGDGLLTSADWARRSRDGSSAGSPLARTRARRGTQVVATYFQNDEPGSVTLEEIRACLNDYDTDGDGLIDEEEFTCAYEAREVEVPGRGVSLGSDSPWEALIAATDGDEDGAVTLAELTQLFEATDSNSDGVWSFSQAARRSRGGDSSRPARPEPPAVGVVAPDFTLASPDGEQRVTLSSFAGDKPVALIFGSYT